MKQPGLTGVFVLAALGCVLVFGRIEPARAAGPETSECFKCHTSARKLIDICRDVARQDKGTPGKSAETEGEG
ncbi:MAG: hypothetical protein JW718_08710 [Desulfovibrionaceae bacterium]|nr:hypothetical protein [Desulfovibrionaceae bacterium]